MSGPVPTRRVVLRQLAAAGIAPVAALYAGRARPSGALLPISASLQQELALAQQLRQPLVVMVSLHGCPFCEAVRSSHLAPMLHRERLPVVQIDLLSRTRTEDFSGNPLTHDELVRKWRVSIAPTVLFFGQAGQEIADRMEGGYLPDFYASYLDDRLAAARRKLTVKAR